MPFCTEFLMILRALSADIHGIGRFDISLLSQQARMELIAQEFACNTIFKDENGDFLDIADWPGLEVNDDGEVTEIAISNEPGLVLRGSPFLVHLLPDTIDTIQIPDGMLKGSLDCTQLPVSATIIHLALNDFSGSVDLTQLPLNMHVFDISSNNFSGSVDITKLPSTVESFNLSFNKFSGTLDVGRLPAVLEMFEMFSNKFQGSLDVSTMPSTLVELTFDENSLTGSVDCTRLPLELI